MLLAALAVAATCAHTTVQPLAPHVSPRNVLAATARWTTAGTQEHIQFRVWAGTKLLYDEGANLDQDPDSPATAQYTQQLPLGMRRTRLRVVFVITDADGCNTKRSGFAFSRTLPAPQRAARQ